ncbi:MAG TPA: hypothetical protein VJT73_11070 [Polyangiaceae bacterium]|nr:hypothetical protein [Polyangiaceae bacterium]
MTTLSSLVVARQVASIAQVDEALARQVVDGGDLPTCMLEVGTVNERTLLPVLAEAFGIDAAPAGELPMATSQVLRLVPRAVAHRYGLYPIEEREGELRVAVAEPLPMAVEDDLGFALGVHLRQLAAPLVRIRQAIARDYGIPLDARLLKLLAKLERAELAAAAPVPPPQEGDLAPASAREQTPPLPGASTNDEYLRVSRSGTLVVGHAVSAAPPPSRMPGSLNPTPPIPAFSPPAKRNTWPGMLFVRDDETPAPPPVIPAPPPAPARIVRQTKSFELEPDLSSSVAPLATPEVEAQESPEPIVPALESMVPASLDSNLPGVSASMMPEGLGSIVPADDEEPRKTPSPPPADFVMEASMATAAQVERRRRHRAEQAPSKVLVGWARRALGNSIPSDRGAERHRGPLTAAAAERELDQTQSGEQAIATFFAFARQYFEYTALFMVHGDLAEGHDAWGPGATRDKVRAIGVVLDLPSVLSTARDRAAPVVLPLKRAGLDADLRADLGRTPQYDVLVLPVVVLGRCVALLYGDDGESPVDSRQIGDVLAMTPLLAGALERILMRRKRAALRDASAVQSKHVAPDRSQMSSVPAPAGSQVTPGSTSVPPVDLSHIAVKRNAWSEEALVDEGWSMPVDSDAAPRAALPAAPKVEAQVKPSPSPAAAEPFDLTKPPRRTREAPPPPQVAVVWPLSKYPIAREEVEEADDALDGAPEVTVTEADDVVMTSLLEDIELYPSPGPPKARPNDTEAMSRPADPLASARMSEGPRAPPASRGPMRDLPPVLIRSDLVDLVIGGGERAERALGEILGLGEAAIPSVFARFPGPLTVDRNLALGDLPRPADCGPVLRVVAAMRRLALPFLAVRSGDADVEVRFWATYLLGELHYSDAAAALLPRLFDENAAVRRIAARSARGIVATDEGMPIRKALDRMIAYPDEPVARRLTALWAVNELKLYRCISAVIVALGDSSDPIVDAAARTLSTLTRQEFGKDARRWSEWWETKGQKRIG